MITSSAPNSQPFARLHTVPQGKYVIGHLCSWGIARFPKIPKDICPTDGPYGSEAGLMNNPVYMMLFPPGPLIGAGSIGRLHRGSFGGKQYAIRVIQHSQQSVQKVISW
jgi:hypothetical protein